MTVRRLAAIDAQTYWMSAAVPSDQFLLYAFGPGSADIGHAVEVVADRARGCAELGLCIAETGFWTYPAWVPRGIGEDQFVVHELADRTWASCLAAVTNLVDRQLDPREMTWRVHVFPDIDGIPGARSATVVVVQICHALGDGVRSAALAGHLFGRAGEVDAVPAPRGSATALPQRALDSALAHRRLVRDGRAGLVPGQAPSRPLLRSNARPSGSRHVRTVMCDRGRLRGPTVTVGVLAAVSAALSGQLRALGDDPSQLAAEVPMAKSGPRAAHNHFGNVGVGLYPDLAFDQRAQRISVELEQRRRRASHPAMRAESAAFAAVPAPVLRWGVAQFDPDTRWPTATGNTVVSSVNRGAKDLHFGGAPVTLTAGFPGLSPMMALTHGVHGIGETIVISVHAAESAIGDIDSYVQRLEHEVRKGN
ncbi:WS/DGAT domain-containing protein [Mycolicibacterium hippocampi]|uniref:O-acyltransferase WSD1 C-terminal domain-containing protein n=1 Tax=Mycolicibacterium hippocampi TaxID=659824 RepID=A0A850PLT4_9MYCO|nr:WS/DGAT domain-containing protein [Mycolicibacterium hippocampi]NVN49687.1 hypothetical protein [Mycolicibacterium hippocampi]